MIVMLMIEPKKEKHCQSRVSSIGTLYPFLRIIIQNNVATLAIFVQNTCRLVPMHGADELGQLLFQDGKKRLIVGIASSVFGRAVIDKSLHATLEHSFLDTSNVEHEYLETQQKALLFI